MKKKNITGYIKLQIPAGKANPSPPVGPALGQRGVNIMEFCKDFNAATQSEEPGSPIRVEITVYSDKTFTYIKKLSPITYYIKKAIGLQKGSKVPGKDYVAKITKKQIEEIAKKKMQDLNANDLRAACSMIEGSAYSMGIEVIEE
jgi:large subunit ribosomal protein L11